MFYYFIYAKYSFELYDNSSNIACNVCNMFLQLVKNLETANIMQLINKKYDNMIKNNGYSSKERIKSYQKRIINKIKN